MLYKTASVADFIMSDEHLQLLSSVNKLVFDEHSKVRPLSVLLGFFTLYHFNIWWWVMFARFILVTKLIMLW